MTTYFPERTVQYKTYLKTKLIAALGEVFEHHLDPLLRETKVTVEYPKTEADFPAVVIRYFGRDIKNAGVGHKEPITLELDDGHEQTWYLKHFLYTGDIEFAVYALSSYDRDLVLDTVVQTLTMGKVTEFTNRFYRNINPEQAYRDLYFIAVNEDYIQEFGESQMRAPWGAEDDVLYMSSVRVGVFGEMYSIPPDVPFEYIHKVLIYPYIQDIDPVPQGNPGDGGEWEP